MLRNLPVDLREREKRREELSKQERLSSSNSQGNFKIPYQKVEVEASFDLKKFLHLVLRRWYFLLLGCIAGLSFAYLINTFKAPVYEAELLFHISEEKSPFVQIDAGLISESENRNAFAEQLVAVLKSRKHNLDVINTLNLTTRYTNEVGLKSTDVYEVRPFTVSILDSSEVICNQFIYVIDGKQPYIEGILNPLQKELAEDTSSMSTDEVRFKYAFQWGDTIDFFGCRLVLTKSTQFPFLEGDYCFEVVQDQAVINHFVSNLSIGEALDSEYMFSMQLTDYSEERAVEYLNTSIEFLKQYEIDKKNTQAENTIRFIREQVLQLTDTINSIQTKMSAYRRFNSMLDISSEGQLLFEQRTQLREKLASITYEEQYYSYLKSYLLSKDKLQGIIAPSTAGIEDALLHSLVTDIVNISLELQELNASVQEDSPIVNRKKFKLEALKSSLLENVQNLQNTTRIERLSAENELDAVNEKVASLPLKEQGFIDIQREFEVTNEQLVYLLQKLSETEMQKAGTVSNVSVIDKAIFQKREPISPVPIKNYLLGLTLGLGLPIGLFAATSLLSDKVLSEKDVVQSSGIPVIGRIYTSNFKTQSVVRDHPESHSAESFRGIRSNIRYLRQKEGGDDSRIILVTSSIGGEGKTFTSINIAESLAAYNKKTVLVELDLRKPRVFVEKEISNDIGVSTFLHGKCSFDDIVNHLPNSNLDLVTSGPLAPNPAELLVLDKFNIFINELRNRYDYIVFDTAPIGLVSDTLEMMNFADVNLYMVRYNYTRKTHLEPLKDYTKENRARNLYLIINDIPKSEKGVFGYGFGHNNES